MATSGTLLGTVSQNDTRFEFKLIWSKDAETSASRAANQSTVTAKLYITRKGTSGNFQSTSNNYAYITVNGNTKRVDNTTFDTTSFPSDWKEYLILTHSVTIPHTAGTIDKIVNVSAGAYILGAGYGPGTCTLGTTGITVTGPAYYAPTLSNINITANGTSAININFTATHPYGINKYTFKLNAGSTNEFTPPKTITGLTPGTTYKVTIGAQAKDVGLWKESEVSVTLESEGVAYVKINSTQIKKGNVYIKIGTQVKKAKNVYVKVGTTVKKSY